MLVPTPVGDARVFVDRSPAPRGTVVLGHGAGGGFRARDLAVLRRELPALGFDVVAVEQPWKVAGRRVATAPARLDRAWLAVLAAVTGDGVPAEGGGSAGYRAGAGPLVVGGRSAGARVACRTAREVGAAGVLGLAFPLHPPGRPERTRLPELAAAGVPSLVVQGERDTFGGPAEFPLADLPHVELCPVPAADHGFKVPAAGDVTQREALAILVDAVAGWLGRHWPP
jgi:uncharacterized protein